MRWTSASVCALAGAVLGCSGTTTAAPQPATTSSEIHPLEAPPAVAEALPSAPAALVPVSPHSAEVVAFAWSRDGRFAASFDRDGHFAMTDRDGRVHLHTQVHAGSSHLLARLWLDDATRYAALVEENGLVVLDLATGEVVLEESTESFGRHRHVAFDAARARVAWIPRRREAPYTLELLALQTGARASAPVDRVSELRLAYDHDELLLAHGDEVEARDAVTGEPVATADEARVDEWPPVPSLREGVASPDGTRTAIVTDGGWALRGADGGTIVGFENARVLSSPYRVRRSQVAQASPSRCRRASSWSRGAVRRGSVPRWTLTLAAWVSAVISRAPTTTRPRASARACARSPLERRRTSPRACSTWTRRAC
jgi:hypothetical protein